MCRRDLKLSCFIVNMTDTNIDNYSVEDILGIFNLTEPTPFNVKDKGNALIAKMKTDGKPDLEKFFTLARDKVLDYLKSNNVQANQTANEAAEGMEELWANGSVPENIVKNPINYFSDASRMVAENQNLSVAESNVPPLISTSIIIIDSQYRTNILPYSSNPNSNSFNTNFTFNLSNPITRAVSLTLYSYQIPTSFYAFNSQSGNTFFMYNGFIIQIPNGNYTPQQIVTAINAKAALQTATSGLVTAYNASSNLISFKNNDLLSGPITVVFFIQANVINSNTCGVVDLGSFQTLGINTTLGWLLGFRTTPDITTGDVNVIINPGETIFTTAPPSLNGSAYFFLSIEDYSNQRLTSGLYNITNTKTYATISVPDYYNTIQVACKLREGSLTQAQLYAINAVTASSNVNNNSTGFINKISGPTSGSTFATIPLIGIDAIRPNPYVKFGADVTIFKRKYAAPTTIERLTVTLTDDKGNLVNLFDNDWSFSLLVEEKLN
jgi:hypothetical protein